MKLSSVVALAVLLTPGISYSQFSPPEKKLPGEERYLYPIKPGQPGSLAGTMGELRATHFHSGIDIRTDNKIGLPVLASKSGYVSRISVNPSGYGNVMYVTHPDGHTTLYAHLEAFFGPIGKYVLREQYAQKTSMVDLTLKPNQFPVQQGDTIALSGNTGSSSGPHLHFDIRDPENYALNPMSLEGFREVVDSLPPYVEKIALRTLDADSRINDQFGRFEFYVQRSGGEFTFPPILATGRIGIEILAKDKLAVRSPFFGGVNYIDMHVNGTLAFKQSIDRINIAETRGILTLMDFKTMRMSGSRFYKLYLDDGNELDFYKQSPADGKISIQSGEEKDIKVDLKDSNGNSAVLRFKLVSTPVQQEVKLLLPMKSDVEYEVDGNTMMVATKPCFADSNKITVYSKGLPQVLQASYYNVNRSVFLIDLRKTIPDSLLACGRKIITRISAAVPPNQSYEYFSKTIDVRFPEKSLYDTVYLTTYHGRRTDSLEVFNIGSRTIPLNKSIQVTIRPEQTYAWDSTYAVYRVVGRAFAWNGGQMQNGAVNFSTREFGDFVILRDRTPPTIKPVSINGSAARFKIRDDLSGIQKFEANINGKWLLMHYDPKTATIWAERLNKAELMKGKFVLKVTDNSGNESTFTKILP